MRNKEPQNIEVITSANYPEEHDERQSYVSQFFYQSHYYIPKRIEMEIATVLGFFLTIG